MSSMPGSYHERIPIDDSDEDIPWDCDVQWPLENDTSESDEC